MGRTDELTAGWLQPINQQIQQGILSQGCVQIDETPIRFLAPGHGRTKLGDLWTCGAPRGEVIFYWKTGRAATCRENIIPMYFRGTIHCERLRSLLLLCPAPWSPDRARGVFGPRAAQVL